MPKYIVRSPFGDRYSVNAPEGATEQDAITYVQKQLGMYAEPTEPLEGPSSEELLASASAKRGFGRALTRGVSRSFSRMGSLITDIIPGMVGSAVGADDYAKQQMEEAAAKEMELQRTNRTQFKSFRDVDELTEVFPFLGETIGEQGANIATTIGTGGVGSLVGRSVAKRAAQGQIDDIIAARVADQTAKNLAAARAQAAATRAQALPTTVPLAQQAAQESVELAARPGLDRLLASVGARGAERGAAVGAFGTSVGLNAPEIFQNIYENTGELAPAVSIFGGAFAGALDSILPLQVLKMFKSTPASFQKEVIRKIGERKGLNSALADYSAKTALGIGKAASSEGLTEGAQEAISIAAEKFVQDGEQFWNSEDFDRILEAGVRGAVGGGAFGAPTGISEAARIRGIEEKEFARREPTEPLTEPPVGEEIDETLPPVPDSSPIAGRSDLPSGLVPSPTGSGMGGAGVPQITPGLNEEVAPEVRDAELTDEDIETFLRQGGKRLQADEDAALAQDEEDAADVAARDIQEEIKKAAAKGKPAPGEPASLTPPAPTLRIPPVPTLRVPPVPTLRVPPAPTLRVPPAPTLRTPPTPTPTPTPIDLAPPTPTPTPTPTSIDLAPPASPEVKTITPVNLELPTIPKNSVLKPLLINKPYGTPQANEELRNTILAKTKNPAQIKQANTIFESIGVPTIDLSKKEKPAPKIPSIPSTAPTPTEFTTPTSDVGLLGGKDLLAASIERDQNAYTAIERLVGRQAAIDQYIGDVNVGKVPQKEALPYSGPEQQTQFASTFDDYENSVVRERLKEIRAAERRRERVVSTEEADIEAATPEAQAETAELIGEEDAFADTPAVPDIEKVTSKRANYEKLRADVDTQFGGLIGLIPKGEEPLQYLSDVAKSFEPKERAPVIRLVKFLKDPENEEFLNEIQLRFAEEPTAPKTPKTKKEKVKTTTYDELKEVLTRFMGRNPETEKISLASARDLRDIGVKIPRNVAGMAALHEDEFSIYGNKGKAMLFVDRIPKGKEISVFMHEVGTHVGMRELIGPTNYNYLINKVYEWGSGKGGELEVSIAKAALARIPKSTRKGAVRDEAIAYFVSEAIERGINPKAVAEEKSPLGTFFRYVMLGIKNILKRFAPGYEPTTQDIIDIAYGAAQLTYKRLDEAETNLAKSEGVAKEDLPKAAAFTDRSVLYAVNSPSNPVGAKALINKINKRISDAPPSAKAAIKYAQNNYSGLSRVARRAYASLLSVTQLAEMAEFANMPELGKKIREISNISTSRDVAIFDRKQEIENFLIKARKITAKFKPEIINQLYDFMHDSSILGVKFDIDKRIAAAQKAKNIELERKLLLDKKAMQNDQEASSLYIRFEEFAKEYPELGKLYYELRDKYKAFSDEFLNTVNQPEVLGAAGKIINELMKNQIDPYFPLYRKGDYWVRFTDKDKKEGVSAFETEADAREFIQFAKQNGVVIDKGPYIKPTEQELGQLMPTKQVQEIIKLLNERNAPPELKEAVYSIYLNLFPNQSIMQAFRKRKNIRGYRQDALANFADVGTRMAINIEQFKTVRKLDGVLNEAITMAEDEGSPMMHELATSLRKREAFLKNPVQKGVMGAIASSAGHNAYRWFILGNISSAIINTLQLPIIVAPLLGGKFGWREATAAMREATAMYFKGGKDNNTSVISPFTKRNLSDFSFAGHKSKLSEEQKRLFANAIQRGAIRRSTGQDLMEIREFGTLDPADKFGYKKMQVEMSFGWTFQNAERFNREVTLLAAYNLARKKMNEAEATEYALNLVEFAHGAAMSELGPQAFQTGILKVVGVFKRFALNQMYLQYKMFRQAFKGADADVRKEARRQLLGIYATSFAFAGIKGVPVYGLVNILASMIAGVFGDDDEPFDLDEIVLSTFGNGVFRGPIGAATNLNLGTRVGFADLLWRPDEKRLADIGLLNYAMEQALGPAVGVIGNIIKGGTQIYEGDAMRGLETLSPSAFKSFMRAWRLATEGAVNSKGFKIIDDPNAFDVMMSAIGFSPNDLNDAYARVSIMKKLERNVQERRNGLLDALWAAREAGDYSGVREVQKEIDEYNKSPRGRQYKIDSDTQQRSYDMRKAKQREAENLYGASINPRLQKAALQEAGVLE